LKSLMHNLKKNEQTPFLLSIQQCTLSIQQ